jgi:MFS transporter, CP family, cyanate transporter
MAILGPMTAVYTTALSIGTAISAGLTVPIADAGGSWRVGLGVWAIFPGAMLIPTITPARHRLIVESGSASRGA